MTKWVFAGLGTAQLAAALAAGLTLAGLGAPAAAHHSTAMYDRDNPVKVRGAVKEFAWVNPHAYVKVAAEGGGDVWVVEMTSPGGLTRLGWSKRSLNPGDKVEVELQPLKGGGAAGLVVQVKNITLGQTFRAIP